MSFDRYGEASSLAAPTLVQQGDGDVVVDPRNAELLVELIPARGSRSTPAAAISSSGRSRSGSSGSSRGFSVSNLTLDRWIRDRARTTPERVAIDFLGAETTYRELDERSEWLAAHLLDAGLVPGDRVATLTGPSPEHVVVFFACAKAGLILLPLNWRLTNAELAYQLADAEPAIVLASSEFLETAAALHERSAPLEELVRNRS